MIKIKLVLLLLCTGLFIGKNGNAQEVTEYAVIENMDLISALAAINMGAECGWGFDPMDIEGQTFSSGWMNYTDMAVISKHVKYKFELKGSSLHMSYFSHEQEDKTRGIWESIPKLTKKDKKTFDEVVSNITAIRDDPKKMEEAIGGFFTNGNHLPPLFEQSSEELLGQLSESAQGKSGRFIWVLLKSVEKNTDPEFSDYEFKLSWAVIPQSQHIKDEFSDSPVLLTHYGNNQPKEDKRNGLFDDLSSLKPDVYPALAVTVVNLEKGEDGQSVVVVTD